MAYELWFNGEETETFIMILTLLTVKDVEKVHAILLGLYKDKKRKRLLCALTEKPQKVMSRDTDMVAEMTQGRYQDKVAFLRLDPVTMMAAKLALADSCKTHNSVFLRDNQAYAWLKLDKDKKTPVKKKIKKKDTTQKDTK
ncbi:hypothetical protein JXM67_14600 [candidate division WOR-3 bacterium]|nr:hypothetical protein [candidate division WOR-3 bacterium]